MRNPRTRAAAVAALVSLVAGGLAPLAGATPDRAPPTRTVASPAQAASAWTIEAATAVVSAATASSCPLSLSCGTGCTATLQTSLCVLSISWTASASLGGVQIGPSFRFECYICECWYTYTSPNGYELFKRTTDGSCSGEFDGLILR